MADLLGHRIEDYRVELLDLGDRVLSELPKVAANAGTLDFSVYATIRGSGNLAVHDDGTDWLRHRIRVSYLLDDMVVPLITAIPRAPVESHTATGVTVDVELYDKTVILSEDAYGTSYGLPAGTNIVDAVSTVITSTGEPGASLLLAPSPATLAAGMVWEAGTTKLRIVNDLLGAAGYFALYCDGMGRFRAEPYTTPSTRPVGWQFEGNNGLYLPEWTLDADVFAVPNRYVVVGRTEGDVPALTSTATDVDPSSPFGYPSRGRWITRTNTDVEASSQLVLDLLAARRLFEAQQVTETFEFTHPWLSFGLNDVVEFDGVRAVVWKQTVKLAVGGLITSTARRLA